MRLRCAGAAGALVFVLAAPPAGAIDYVEMLSGQSHRGRLVSESEDSVVFEVHAPFGRAEVRLAYKTIHSVTYDGAERIINENPEPKPRQWPVARPGPKPKPRPKPKP